MGKYLPDSVLDVFNKTFFVGTLFMIDPLLNTLASLSPAFANEIKSRNMSVQLKTRDNTKGRVIFFRDGKVIGKDGVHPGSDVEMIFENEKIARKVMMGEMLGKTEDFVDAAKNTALILNGPDEKAMWFSSLLLKIFAFDVLYMGNYGETMPNGEKRYVTCTNGGALHVYVKDGRIIRCVPLELSVEDAAPWSIKAHGRQFTPPKRTTIAP